MPRSLSFSYGKHQFDAELVKVDRSQLYGTVRLKTLDQQEQRCSLATLASDGKTLIPKGGTALGYINTLGEWIPRKELAPVSLDGEPLSEVPSSFDNPIALDKASRVSETTFLDHSVRLSYQLAPQGELPKALLKELRSGALISFGFSYRGGLNTDPAFIFLDESDIIWMLVTSVNHIEFVSLEQAALCQGETMNDEIDNDDEDNLDFGML